MDFDECYELLQTVRKKLEKIQDDISDLLDEIDDA
jgi:cell division septum initiation protein DivIVA